MKLLTKFVFAVGSLLLLGLFMFFKGYIFLEKDVHPPCDMLPTIAEVNTALADHQVLIEEIKLLGDNIVVELGKPCYDDPDRGLVLVNYDSKSERNSISEFLGSKDGMGVPVHLVKR